MRSKFYFLYQSYQAFTLCLTLFVWFLLSSCVYYFSKCLKAVKMKPFFSYMYVYIVFMHTFVFSRYIFSRTFRFYFQSSRHLYEVIEFCLPLVYVFFSCLFIYSMFFFYISTYLFMFNNVIHSYTL